MGELAADVLVIAGTFFMFVSSLGVLRLPDFYLRVHAPTKAATLGLTLLLAALVVEVPETGVAVKAVLAVLFVGATAPVGAHVLARAAYRSGVVAVVPPAFDQYAAATRKPEPAPPPAHPEGTVGPAGRD